MTATKVTGSTGNTKSTERADKPPAASTIKTLWLNPRRKRFWGVVAVLLYTLLGFFAVPAIVKSSITSLIEEDLGRTVQIQKVEFNPYVLSLRVQQFEMTDTDVKLAAFDELFVNFQLSSLFRWAWTFREIRFDKPYLYYERFDFEDTLLSRLLADAAKIQPVEEVEEEDKGGLPRLLIHDFKLTEGIVDVRDNVPAMPVDIHFEPINVSIKKLNTLPGRYAQQTGSIKLPGDGSLQWQGNLALAPLDSQGEVEIKNSDMNISTAYLKVMLPLDAVNAKLSSRFKYQVQMDDTGVLDIDIDGLDIELDEVAVTGLSPSTKFFALKQFALRGGSLRYPEQSILFSSLRFDEPQLSVWRNSDNSLSVNELVPVEDDKTPLDPEAEGKESTPWQLGLSELVLTKGSLNWSDQSIKPAATVGVTNLEVKATDITNQDGAKIPLSVMANFTNGGEFGLEAVLAVLPEFSFSGKSKTRNIPLSLAQPYVQQFARIFIEQGKLNSDINIAIPAGEALRAKGALHIPGLKINDTIENKRLLGWKQLDIEQMDLDLGAGKLKLSELMFDQLFGRIIIYKDQTTNLSGLVVERGSKAAPAAEKAASDKKGFDVVIGGVRVDQGSMDFSDQSLPLPFATRIKDLNGTISTIASNSSESANIKLEGQVDEYGLSRINGAINLLDPLRHTGITVEFRNLLMSNLSPYTIQFAGREIDEGRLNLDLQYDIDKSQLQASNKVIISDLQLGDKVDHPDAASLPLGLAVALLKDANGVIDIDLPIEGNIDDPEFRIGGIIWQAFAGLIVKAVTSPFRLLAGLIGVDSDDLGEFQFLAGRADLTPPELEKISQLKQALLQRPKLSVEISGAFDPKIDTPALKYSALRRALILKKGDESGELADIDILDERLFKPLKSLFAERFPNMPLKTIRNENKKPPADNPEGRPVLDKLAYAADLRDRLLETVVISEENLTALAQARAEAIKAAFLTDEFDASRIEMVEPEKVESEDEQWVKFELGVTAK